MNIQPQEYCDHQDEDLTCTNVAFQYADVAVPLKLNPYTLVGKVAIECCGNPIVTLHPCQSTNCSCGCEIVVTQTVCFKIPLEYGATVDVGNTTSNCKRNQNCTGNGYI